MISSKENEGYCYLAVKKLTVFLREITIVMPLEKDNILEVNQYMKSDKMPYIIYADIKSLIKKKIENSSTTKKGSIFLADIQCHQFDHLIA